MVDVNLLKSEYVKRGYTQTTLCKAIGMSPSTFTRRLQEGVFGTDEAEKIIDELNLTNGAEIFFAKKLT